MATIIHTADPDADISGWKGKADFYHMQPTNNHEISYRYIIMKGNIIEGTEAKW